MSDEYSNFPPGTFGGDPMAPWNEGDGDGQDVGMWCGNCRFFCAIWPEDASRRDALGYACARDAAYGDLFEVSDDSEPCGLWAGM